MPQTRLPIQPLLPRPRRRRLPHQRRIFMRQHRRRSRRISSHSPLPKQAPTSVFSRTHHLVSIAPHHRRQRSRRRRPCPTAAPNRTGRLLAITTQPHALEQRARAVDARGPAGPPHGDALVLPPRVAARHAAPRANVVVVLQGFGVRRGVGRARGETGRVGGRGGQAAVWRRWGGRVGGARAWGRGGDVEEGGADVVGLWLLLMVSFGDELAVSCGGAVGGGFGGVSMVAWRFTR